jgi:hypothetical protein
MADEFDDLDDYLDEFDEEILSQEPGATIPKHENDEHSTKNKENDNDDSINELKDINKMVEATGLDPDFAQSIAEFMSQLDPNGNGNELEALLDNENESLTEFNENDTIGNGGFQSTINETINRLKTSSQQVDEESTKKMNKDEELLTTLLNSLDIGGDVNSFEGMDELKDLLNGFDNNINENGDTSNNNNNDDDDEGLDKVSNVLLKMLNRLTSKEMMYETVSSAVINYQDYFKDNKNKTNVKPEDHERYLKQLEHLQNVKNSFDKEDYSEDDQETRDYIDQQMESYNKLLPPPPGVIQDNLGEMGLDGVKWNDKEVPNGLEECIQQ